MAIHITKPEYLMEIRQLHLRAKRSGWNLKVVHRNQIAAWLGIKTDKMLALNREFSVELDDIRSGNNGGSLTS